ncbi:MAG: GTPase HflX [Nitrosopumilaceae archaeon]|nr:GTPase HflX [Nitrosopumilaceae archaeon]NIT99937.1 GTPase HflX [Nitrosopumilaceae archaeon]NIU86291.1 GTPase HflX [Nitrosopumilaceae archaeon]NIV65046.1 GTPase HflX [Nitrosopumilaceae archaeon]NIX60540.1 GTPase HflX [Nitrosopumilaceae archaeon]
MKTAFLITYDKPDSIDEAVALCEAAGYKIQKTITQKFLNRPKYGIGEGLLDDIASNAEKLNPDVIVYDEVLKPSQNYNLASRLHRNILDREALILEIFESRASSSESKLQVKLAQMRYEMSRAREKVRLAKMGEQPGFMGIGQFEVDVYYNDINHRMQGVKSKLKKAGKQRELHRQARKRQGFKTISLAGYTSAGKTTLFNKLTGEKRDSGEELFTTLSTTTRKIEFRKDPCLISDTVGFISKLPAYMIEAFKSTLEEMIHTDLIIVVIDAGDSFFELKKKFQSCIKTLTDLGVSRERMIFALNKTDLLTSQRVDEVVEILSLDNNKQWVPISAKTGENITRLKDTISDALEDRLPVKNDKISLREELEKLYGN